MQAQTGPETQPLTNQPGRPPADPSRAQAGSTAALKKQAKQLDHDAGNALFELPKPAPKRKDNTASSLPSGADDQTTTSNEEPPPDYAAIAKLVNKEYGAYAATAATKFPLLQERIKTFQTAMPNLNVTGILDQNTWNTLRAPIAQVRELQRQKAAEAPSGN